MKINIKCPKCGRSDIKIISDEKNPVPMYRCMQCGHKNPIFPQLGGKEGPA